ncbi:hypothetical protein BOTBODRAFT_480447 [Botryobasidium botryosum FD-172 SS1]|uniref:Uncharacterized protein n=1 Tax=Botryobasidium botryosum (strain FD-172 SS1) TaxID=930990 RepID=A0A067MTA2_BOTB1|nr:hypothetical protein BOTBODRAFT_480447 [Botryobasidium botryosum FD-172 SS1]
MEAIRRRYRLGETVALSRTSSQDKHSLAATTTTSARQGSGGLGDDLGNSNFSSSKPAKGKGAGSGVKGTVALERVPLGPSKSNTMPRKVGNAQSRTKGKRGEDLDGSGDEMNLGSSRHTSPAASEPKKKSTVASMKPRPKSEAKSSLRESTSPPPKGHKLYTAPEGPPRSSSAASRSRPEPRRRTNPRRLGSESEDGGKSEVITLSDAGEGGPKPHPLEGFMVKAGSRKGKEKEMAAAADDDSDYPSISTGKPNPIQELLNQRSSSRADATDSMFNKKSLERTSSASSIGNPFPMSPPSRPRNRPKVRSPPRKGAPFPMASFDKPRRMAERSSPVSSSGSKRSRSNSPHDAPRASKKSRGDFDFVDPSTEGESLEMCAYPPLLITYANIAHVCQVSIWIAVLPSN